MKDKKLYILLAAALYTANVMAQKDTLSTAKQTFDLGKGVICDLREMTGAVSTATADDLSHRNSIKASNQLYGMLPGLTALQNKGTAWESAATFYVRGLGTLSERAPLVIVDGIERSIDELSSEEIESVSVLKDAAATAIYGVRGGNGVILVRTKRGSSGAPQINVSYEFSMGKPIRLPKMVDGYTYAQALNEAMHNDGLDPFYSQKELDAFRDNTNPDFYSNVDWVNETLRNNSYGDNISVSARGGGKYVRYYTMLNFLDNRGILKHTNDNDGYSTQLKYSRLNIRTNLDIDLTPTTLVQLNLMANFSEHNRPNASTANIFNAIYDVPAAALPIYSKNGGYGATNTYKNNPVSLIAGTGYSRSQTRAMYADMHLRQNLSAVLPGLSAGFRIGLDNTASYWDGNSKKPLLKSNTIDLETGKETFSVLQNESSLSFSKSVGSVITFFKGEAYADYTRQWDKHNLRASLLYSMDKKSTKDQNTGRAFMDIVGSAHYSYAGKYLADFSLSGSASSLLKPGNRWGVFPSVGAGWVLSEENFMKAPWLNLFKVRASYGIAGRADYAVNLYKDLWGTGNAFFFRNGTNAPASSTGMKYTQLGIGDLTYEKSHKFNVGVDFKAFNKLGITLDAFYDHRTDILVGGTGAVSGVFGMSVPQINNGVIDNRGFEAALSWDDNIGDLNYHIGGQFSFARNKIVNQNEQYRPYDYLKRTGREMGINWGYEVIGIYKSQEDIDNRNVKQLLSEVTPGDLMFKDQNGDGVIDSYDQIPLGYSSLCPEIYYSFDLGAEWKGIGFYAQFQGVGNYSKVLNTASIYRPIVGNCNISQYYWENRWSESNPNGTLPRLTYTGSDNNYTTNSMWVVDGSFLKCRTMELYYKLPEKMLKRSKFLGGVKLFARANDLFCIDSIDLRDPEAIGVGYPTMTTYTFGFNLSF